MGSWEENVLAGVYNDPMPMSDPMEADDMYDDCDDDL
jgi:hypothetical protein